MVYLCDTAFEIVVEPVNDVHERFMVHLFVFEHRISRLPAYEPRHGWVDDPCAQKRVHDALVALARECLDVLARRPIIPSVLRGRRDIRTIDATFKEIL